MTRRLFAMICATLLVLSMTGCNDSGNAGMNSTVSTTMTDDSALKESLGTTSMAGKGGASETERGSMEPEAATETTIDRPVLELGTMYIREADDENDVVYVSGNHDTMRLSGDSAKNYPELAAALDQYMVEETEQTKNLITDYVQYYKEDSAASDIAPYGYEIRDNLFVRRADRRVLSILGYSYDFAGGAHGNITYKAWNFDASTGKNITLDDVISDREQLGEHLKAELPKKYSETAFFEDMPETIDKEVKETEEGMLTWTLDPQGITFYFDPYEIAPYSEGIHTVTILYTSLPELFTDQYRPEEGQGYICGMAPYTEYSMDVDQDGEADDLSVNYTVDEETDSIQNLSVSVNNKTLSIDEIYCYSVEPIMILAADGRTFLYIWCRGDNDFVNMYIFDLSLGSPVSMGSMALAEVYTYIEEENVDYSAYKLLITDPQNMRLSSRCVLLSTYDIQKNFHLQENSPVPVSEDPYYTIVREVTLTSVKDITADLVDEEGKVIDKAQSIPSGSTFQLYRTDGEHTVDALLPDGRIARLLVTGTYPQYINGLDVNDLFEALYYAG